MPELIHIERQLGLIDQHAPALTDHERVGFELGWDYAHYRVALPARYAQEASPLRDGVRAGAATFGVRTLAATRHVRKWLQLRLHAWLRGRSVELVQITPNYLQQLDVSHCPITRVALSAATLESSDASVDRVRNDAGYWDSVETYISAHSDANFSHGICPTCLQIHHPQVYARMREQGRI